MITTPTLLLDPKRCHANIEAMVTKAQQNQLTLRPHFKTHQSQYIGQWFRDLGVQKITVSSLNMAAYFAEDGWDDITVAFPTNILEIDLINHLASRIKLNLLVQSQTTLNFLKQHLKYPVCCLIKIDLGSHRTGIQADHLDELDQLIHNIETSNKLVFSGFIGHAGHSYAARGQEAVQQVHYEAIAKMSLVYHYYENKYPNICISIGDTPTCSLVESFGCATEIRPGNFVFYDAMQAQIGACTLDQIAVAVACPIVAMHPDRNEIIIYGGGIHFSKESYEHQDYGHCFGLVVQDAPKGSWAAPIEDTYVSRLYQEHGVVKCSTAFMQSCQIGQIIKILPVHSCMTANLLQKMQTTTGKSISMMPILYKTKTS